MRMPTGRRHAASWIIAVGALALASCIVDTSGTLYPGPKRACLTDGDCDDFNPCTVDTCGPERFCTYSNVADGPQSAQISGDCQRIDCEGGFAVTVDDGADVPDDGKECTDDTCAGGVPSNQPRPMGTPCGAGGMSMCDGLGSCQ